MNTQSSGKRLASGPRLNSLRIRSRSRPANRQLRVERLEDRCLLAVVVVNTPVDEADGSILDDVSLRDAVTLAPAGSTIEFAPALTSGGPITISLPLGELLINKNLSIVGPGAQLITLRAHDPTAGQKNGDGARVFRIDDANDAVDSTVSISGLALTGGDVSGYGGAVLNRENLTLTGCAFTNNAASEAGGAFSTSGEFDQVTLTNCSFSNNTASVGGAIDARGKVRLVTSTVSGNNAGIGGGIFHQGQEDRRLTIESSTISGNSATEGGGISAGYITMTGSTISNNTAFDGGGMALIVGRAHITGSKITGNTAVEIAGGIYMTGGTDITIIDSEISGNTGNELGGGLLSNSQFEVRLTNTLVHNNTGGGVLVRLGPLLIDRSTISANSVGGVITQFGPVTITNSTVSGNFDGGGLFIDGGVATITSSTISGNSSIYDGGGIYGVATTLTITNSTVSGNSSEGYGGGIAGGENGHLFITSSTITGNSALEAGGVYQLTGNAQVTNSIIAKNTTEVGVPSDFGGGVELRFSLLGVDAGATIVNGGGNLIGTLLLPREPLLAPLANNGGPMLTHALLPGSPAIDTGTSALPDLPQFDQRGAPFARNVDGNGTGGPQVDMGAVERQPIPAAVYGDYNQNGVADAADIVLWRNTLGATVPPHSGADGNGNGVIDAGDRDVWRARFGLTVPTPAAGGGGEGTLAAEISELSVPTSPAVTEADTETDSNLPVADLLISSTTPAAAAPRVPRSEHAPSAAPRHDAALIDLLDARARGITVRASDQASGTAAVEARDAAFALLETLGLADTSNEIAGGPHPPDWTV